MVGIEILYWPEKQNKVLVRIREGGEERELREDTLAAELYDAEYDKAKLSKAEADEALEYAKRAVLANGALGHKEQQKRISAINTKEGLDKIIAAARHRKAASNAHAAAAAVLSNWACAAQQLIDDAKQEVN